MNIGTVIDKLIWFGVGIYFIFLSVKNKEKLKDKAALVRFAGITFIILGIVFSLMSVFK